MKLTDEQKIVMKESVKVYLVPEQRMGKVEKVTPELITINIGTTKEPMRVKFSPKEYESKILKDDVVLQKRVIFGKSGEYEGVKPLDNPLIQDIIKLVSTVDNKEVKVDKYGMAQVSPIISAEIGYINEKTGRFRLTPKEGYVRIEYKEVETQRVTLDLTDEQIKLLEEMGIKG